VAPPSPPTTPTARTTLGVYRRLVGARIRADWQYRTSFLLFLLGQTLVAALDFATIAVIFRAVDVLAGWTVEEVAYLYGTSGVAFGLADLFASPVDRVGQHIKAGSFDGFLLRPIGTVWQLVGLEFALRRVGRTLQPALVLVVALARSGAVRGPAELGLVVVSVLSGTAIYGALWVVTTAPSFWVIDSIEAANSFTYGGQTLAQYPLDVMGRWLRRIATFAVPLASVAYLPGCWLFDKPFPSGLPRWSAWTGPVVALAMVAVARAAWALAVRHYRSTGS
jgi:ABC-2 type transport system permease protein